MSWHNTFAIYKFRCGNLVRGHDIPWLISSWLFFWLSRFCNIPISCPNILSRRLPCCLGHCQIPVVQGTLTGILIVLPCGRWAHRPLTVSAVTQLCCLSPIISIILASSVPSKCLRTSIQATDGSLHSFSKRPTIISRRYLIVFVKGVPSGLSWSVWKTGKW